MFISCYLCIVLCIVYHHSYYHCHLALKGRWVVGLLIIQLSSSNQIEHLAADGEKTCSKARLGTAR